jgi:hypothetical protein
MMKKQWAAGLVLALAAVAALPASADTIPVASGSWDGAGAEHSVVLAGILAGMPAGTSLSKVGDAGDIFWSLTGASGTVSVEAKYAGYHQDFGYFDSTNAFVPLIHAYGNGQNPAVWVYPAQTYGPTSATFTPDVNPFTLGNRPTAAAHGNDPAGQAISLWSSDPAANGGHDHMVTYDVLLNGVSTGQYLLAWEDLGYNPATGKLGDHDFQDLIVLVSGIKPVPEPGTMALLGTGVLGLVAWSRRRKALGKS